MNILFAFETKAQQKVRENYRLSVRQAREEEELMRQQAARREAGLEGRRSKIFVKFGIFICFFTVDNFVTLIYFCQT